MPERQSTVRHLLTGTPCAASDCEECKLQWMLTGNVYLLRQEICQAFAVPPRLIGVGSRPEHLRFRLVRCIDRAAIWLAGHDLDRAAIRLWRIFRLW